ncbi:F-box/FBD/LRR-repeat protein At5g18770 [Arabidopsis lyrata subsp. lyrata]|uniref:F-box/FBD/LRR-repeat protein At5g18770 n=1 Tax=Arabidopsis lyrata subsp. lyrata TaxID=81972 RepID=UPI000A29CBC2|nr:F-box/FBD/LRR-repeat protein At5g18770 [Arabidopsis lyrata subsp. lyrata]|eukprot:XP_020876667.1 F-box/FBD/LRR-repeat protein At5g18770 [Arabidopsis lyrata subsp. lyrata]
MVNLIRKFAKRVGRPGIQIWRGEDMISSLPDHLLYRILGFLTTEEAVWTSVLSSRWRNLWKWVPTLELDTSDFPFPCDKTCAAFIDKFLNFQSDSYLREFKLRIDHRSDVSLYEPCLGVVIKKPNIRHFQVESDLLEHWNTNEIPLTLSACEALVCLKLHLVRLNDFESLSLPCLKIMYLEDVFFPSDAAVEMLISCSPVLEDLKISLNRYDDVVVLRVYSQSLKSFTLKRKDPVYAINGAHTVLVDTPRLEYMSLMDYQFKSFKILSMSDSVKVDLDVNFELMRDNLSERNIIYNLLNNFSGVRDVTISWKTLKFIYSLQDMNLLPKFHDLTRLRATMFSNASLEVLPIVLESCPKLKHFTLELVNDYPVAVITRLSNVLSHCLVSSLETVEMESPITEKATELKLARYFLENSATLKKLVLRLNHESTGEKHEPGVLKQLIESPRRSSLCQFEVLPVPPNPEPWWIYVKPQRF